MGIKTGPFKIEADAKPKLAGNLDVANKSFKNFYLMTAEVDEFDTTNHDAITSVPHMFDAWINSANLDSADVNTTAEGALVMDCDAHDTNWTTGGQTSPFLYTTADFNSHRKQSVAVLVSSNADVNNEYAGVAIVQDDDNTKFCRMQMGYNSTAHNETITSLTNGNPNVHVAGSASNITDGIWLRITRCGMDGRDVLVEYANSSDEAYPDHWTYHDYVEDAFTAGSSIKMGLMVKTGNTTNTLLAAFKRVVFEI